MDKAVAVYSETDFSPDDFDHLVWSQAEPIPITRLWSGEEAPASRHAEARLVWTPVALHVRYVCEQHEPLLISSAPRFDGKTIGLWERDVCEIFVAPDPQQPNRYLECEAAPTGEWVDLTVLITPTHEEKDFEFESGMTVGKRFEGTQLKIAMRIPWNGALPKPQHGDEWRANVFRCIGTGDERYMAWQPTFTAEPNFHVPSAFGVIRLL